jgi:hypothetical protein
MDEWIDGLSVPFFAFISLDFCEFIGVLTRRTSASQSASQRVKLGLP